MGENLNFTFYDTIGYLVPGIMLVYSINLIFNFGFDPNISNALIYIIVSYIAGSILNMLSLFLYRFVHTKNKLLNKISKISKWLTIPMKRLEYPRDELCSLVKTIYGLDFSKNKLGLYSFADSLTSNSPADKEILMAKEGLFRNLTILSLILMVISLFEDTFPRLTTLIVGIVSFELLYYGREYYKELKNQRIYLIAYFKIKEIKNI